MTRKRNLRLVPTIQRIMAGPSPLPLVAFAVDAQLGAPELLGPGRYDPCARSRAGGENRPAPFDAIDRDALPHERSRLRVRVDPRSAGRVVDDCRVGDCEPLP